MNIGIIGAGAIGGLFAGRLGLAGHTVNILARGATLEMLREHGQRLESEGQSHSVPVNASDRAEDLGVQDIVILAVKAPSLIQVLPALPHLCDRKTIVVPALNGLPWWYFLGSDGPLAGHQLLSVDPGGLIEQAIAFKSLLGCVVFPAAYVRASGHVVHVSGNRVVFGEPTGGMSERSILVATIFRDAGFEAEASETVRSDIWLKLLGNACFNPVSLLTRSATDTMIDEPALTALFLAMMEESLAIAAAASIPVSVRPAPRLAITRRLGHVKTSMLQDAQAGRPVELEAIMGALVEVAEALTVPAPLLRAVYAMARLHAVEAGLMPASMAKGDA